MNTLKALLLTSLTVLYWQTSKGQTTTIPDTVKCYGRTTLEKIAKKVIHAAECDTLYSIEQKKNNILKQEIETQETIIENQNTIIANKDIFIDELKKDVANESKKREKAQKWAKIAAKGFATIFAIDLSVIGGVILYKKINH